MTVLAPFKKFPEVKLVSWPRYYDDRGSFAEIFRLDDIERELGHTFVQTNLSVSRITVFRGLHYQLPYPQGKLIKVVHGSILDVVVDIRKSSPTFGKYAHVVLTDQTILQLWVPPGFAHGFLALDDHTKVMYHVTEHWQKACDRCIRWDDPDINLELPIDKGVPCKPILSDKDKNGQFLKDAITFE
jgi:dTDP-4-dehydrorhamnose 3,5-epimerase